MYVQRVTICRVIESDSLGSKIRQQTAVIKNIQTAKETITHAKDRNGSISQQDFENLTELLCSVQVFEAEIFAQRQEWDCLLGVINVRNVPIDHVHHVLICGNP